MVIEASNSGQLEDQK